MKTREQMKLLSLTTGELLYRTAQWFPERPALEYYGRIWTYHQLDAETDQLAKGFLALGVLRGNHVALWTENHPNTLLCCYALLKIGVIPVFLGGCATERELSERVTEGECTYLLFSGQVHGIPVEAVVPARGLPGVRVAYCIDDESAAPGLEHIRQAGNTLPEGMLEQAKAAVRPDDPDILLFTSGSSGRPKGVLLTHYARINDALALAAAMRITEKDRFCCALPLFHCFAFTANAICALAAGACICFPESVHTADVLRTIQEKRCTIFMGVPTMFSAILARPDLDSYDLSSLRTGLMAGSSYPPTLFLQARRALGYQLLPAYGLTEATGGVTCGSFSDSEELLSRSVGKPLPHIEIRIWDGDRRIWTSPGETGEIFIRGYCVMDGYYGQDHAEGSGLNADGWFATGDIGKMDKQGNLYIVGRRKELIIRGGENILPTEIEDAIMADRRVAQVKVVGIPDPHYIEEICACVVPKTQISAAEIQDLVRASLGPRKIPKYVLFIDALPQNATGKIDFSAVRTIAMERLRLNEL